MEKIVEFLKIDSHPSGYGDGDGYGSGDGYGYGSGYGSGYGYGSGDGSGDGSGYGLKSLNNQKIYLIDGVQPIIKSVKNNIAKGFIVQSDLTLVPCYIAKGENTFAHGETLSEALTELNRKLLLNSPIEERIVKFKEAFSSFTEKYKAIDFYNWHTLLTGSCNLGKQ